MDRDLPPLDIYIDIPRRLQFLHRDVGGAYEEPEAPDDSTSTVAADESEESSSEDNRDLDFEPSSDDGDDAKDLSYLGDD